MGGVRFHQYYDARGAGFCSWRTEFREDCHSYGKPTAADRAENSLLNFAQGVLCLRRWIQMKTMITNQTIWMRAGGVGILALLAVGSGKFSASIVSAADKDVDWPAFSGHTTGDHYSSLSQIN